MSQCVPNWDLDDSSVPTRLHPRPHHPNSTAMPHRYEIAELTWENGQLSMHGLGPPRVPTRPASDRPCAATAGTLESIVNLATQKPTSNIGDLVPWSDTNIRQTPYRRPQPTIAVPQAATAAATVTMDALVPSQPTNEAEGDGAVNASRNFTTCKAGEAEKGVNLVPRVPAAAGWCREQCGSVSVSRSGTVGGDSRHVPTLDTCGFGLTSTSFCSQGNTVSISSGGRATATNNTTGVEDHDSVCHSAKTGTSNAEERKKGTSKSSLSTKRSRAAAIHNQSERKRRDKINQKMKTLQKMVPNSSKTDKASMLDEVIEYLKQLQAQLTMVNRMGMQPVMMPLAMQQQLQMSMMNPMAHAAMGMGMGMGVGMGMDINMNPMARQNLASFSPIMNPTGAFMPMASWDAASGNGHGLPSQTTIGHSDPLSTYLASQPQPVTVEAYSRMIAIMQQQQQQQQQQNQAPASKN